MEFGATIALALAGSLFACPPSKPDLAEVEEQSVATPAPAAPSKKD